MHVLIATTGALSPGPCVEFTERMLGEGGQVTVTTVIEVPRSFLEDLRSDRWHPLDDGGQAPWRTEEDALIARYVAERGKKITDPIVQALRGVEIEADARYLEGEDPAMTISKLARDLGTTRQIFEETAWESVSARVMTESGRAVLVIPPDPRNGVVPATEEEPGE
jgi:hypothetical protein